MTIMINIPNFYPTPINLIHKLLDGIDFKSINSISEPSAGQGHIVDAVIEKLKYAHSDRYNKEAKWDIDCIEIDENLRHILKGKGYRVVHDDFLTFDTFKKYDLIVMNPPFDGGDKHLLKALDLMKNGGIIRCLLNAETIRNPFSNVRKDLARRLEEYDAEIEFIKDAFIGAERKTAVEIALIKINIPASQKQSVIINDLKREERYYKYDTGQESLIDADPIKAIVERYNFEIKAGLKLIEEYEAMRPHLLSSVKGSNSAIFELKTDGGRETITGNNYIGLVRAKYWKALFLSDMFVNHFTSNLRNQYVSKIDELQNYDFSLYNIYSIKAEVIKTMSKSIEDTILALFEEFSNKHHWYDEMSKNIHYYSGWKTNSCWKINKRVIIPLSAFDSWNGRLYLKSRIQDKLMDIEKIFDYLDGGRTDHIDLNKALQQAQEAEQTAKIPLKYFKITVYKKGTCHIEFTNLELLKKFNLFGSQQKGWLPPNFSTTDYRDMSEEEKTVVDSFCGEEEYKKIMDNRDYYLVGNQQLLMLGVA
jgi:hypothetical protein